MKYLELHEGKPILSIVGKVFKKCLNSSTLPKKNYNKEQKAADADKKCDENKNPEQLIWKDVRECLDSLIDRIEEQQEQKPTQTETAISQDRKRKLQFY